jgi:hypothetical protein
MVRGNPSFSGLLGLVACLSFMAIEHKGIALRRRTQFIGLATTTGRAQKTGVGMGDVFTGIVIVWCVSPVIFWFVLRGKNAQLVKLRSADRNLSSSRASSIANRRDADKSADRVASLGKEIDLLDKSIEKLGVRLLKDNVKFIGGKVTSNNYASSKTKLEKLFEFCGKNEFNVPAEEKSSILLDLKTSFELAVRKQVEREEQARIKRQIRDEAKLEADRKRELLRLENEQLAIETALQKALAKATDEHDSEVERLRAQLAEAQTRSERAKSMAQLTRAGYVYVISNIGSFGKGVYKVGMTRRLEPLDRVKELGDASVPFPYDVHMMISSDDAPALENLLHKSMHKLRVNKVNLRREFFKVDLKRIASEVERHCGKIEYIRDPDAEQYNESMNMTDEDFNFVTEHLEKLAAETPLEPKGTTVTAESVLPSETPAGQPDPTLDCPLCERPVSIASLVEGENACPHCTELFAVEF